jgi:putative membrane protein
LKKTGGIMDFAQKDLLLAVAHHILIFAIAGVLAFEVGVVRQGLTATDIRRVGRVDAWYGILAALIIAVGFVRVVYAAKGWAYYSVNHFFWAKMIAFAIVGLLSAPPTIAYLRWRNALKTDPSFLPAPQAIATARRFLWLEVVVFAFIPVFAALMARGYGMPS